MRGKQLCSFSRCYIKLARSAHTHETHLSNQLALTPSRIAAWSIGETWSSSKTSCTVMVTRTTSDQRSHERPQCRFELGSHPPTYGQYHQRTHVAGMQQNREKTVDSQVVSIVVQGITLRVNESEISSFAPNHRSHYG